jgi:hypothetical protein
LIVDQRAAALPRARIASNTATDLTGPKRNSQLDATEIIAGLDTSDPTAGHIYIYNTAGELIVDVVAATILEACAGVADQPCSTSQR